jgi:hypothetical protein
MDITTGQMPSGYSSGGGSHSTGVSKKERIEKWYLEPLERMSGHEAFVCLCVVFLLYEKYLRRTEQIDENERFTKGHKVFKLVGSDLGVDQDTAFELWANWRNGLLHRAMPLSNDSITWALSGTPKVAVSRSGNQLTLNPWIIRDIVVNKVRQKKHIWQDTAAPLMDVYVTEI